MTKTTDSGRGPQRQILRGIVRPVEPGITRRALLMASPAVLAIAAVPVVAKAIEPEGPGEKAERLMQELSDALNDVFRGTFRAVVEPSNAPNAQVFFQPWKRARQRPFDLQDWLETANKSAVINYHLDGLTSAMRDEHSGAWIGRHEADGSIRVFKGAKGRGNSTFVSYVQPAVTSC